MGFFIGIDGKAREVKDMYIGIDGKARKVKTAFIGVDGKARVFYGGYYQPANNEVVLSLTPGEYFVDEKKFAPGRYQVQIAGTPGLETNNCFTMTTTMTEVFQIAAFLSAGDKNGGYASSVYLENLGIDDAGTIFGGRGGLSARVTVSGKTTPFTSGALTWGGACCHFMPLEGVFGTNYLRCFHCGAGGTTAYGGSGAYGGGAGGRGARAYNSYTGNYSNYTGGTGFAGAGGAGGAGGTGTTNNATGGGANGNPGSSGSGIGAGTATSGGVAYYNGSSWSTPTRTNNSNGTAFIIITYLGR